MIVEPATVEHFRRLKVQPHQSAHVDLLQNDDYLRALVGARCWAGVDGERVLAIGGCIDKGGGRAEAWLWMSSDIRHAMSAVVRGCARGLAIQPYRRIEMFCNPIYREQGRLARMLGFEYESTARSWWPDGSPAHCYVRIA